MGLQVLRVRKRLSYSCMGITIAEQCGKNAGQDLRPADRAQQILQDAGPVTFSVIQWIDTFRCLRWYDHYLHVINISP